MLKKLIILSIFLALLLPPFCLAQEKQTLARDLTALTIDWQLRALEFQLQIEHLKVLLEQSQASERILRSLMQELYQKKLDIQTLDARQQLEDYKRSLIGKKKSSE